MSKKTVTLLIGCIWVVAGLVSFLPISLGLHKPSVYGIPSHLVSADHTMQCALDLTPTYAVVSSCVSFYVPCIVMVILYYRLYHYALKHVRSIKQMTRPLQLGSVNGKPATTVPNECQVSEHKAAVTIGETQLLS
jgi:dopamine D1-like receptor